jgi:phosphoribosylformylglycinamidine (FGAM) synthase PurS component
MKIIINVDPKENILDPQGKAVSHALVDAPVETENEAMMIATEMCEKLLYNPLIEKYSIVVEL